MVHTAWVPTATVGSPYITAIAVTGEPTPSVVVSAGELPPGLAFDPLSRVISGVPEAPGEFSFSVMATNSAGTDTRAFNISVAPLTVAPDITTTALPDGKVGTAYEAAVAATGVPAPTFEVVSGALAPGLTLDAVTGKITGTPSEAGDFTWEVAAINSAGRDTQEFRVVIAASPVITPSPTPASSQTPSLAASGIDPTPLILAGAVGALVIVAGAVTFLVGRRRQGRRGPAARRASSAESRVPGAPESSATVMLASRTSGLSMRSRSAASIASRSSGFSSSPTGIGSRALSGSTMSTSTARIA
ncbi:putative Ig domain-containing protein [Microbacterium keratanolyticum]